MGNFIEWSNGLNCLNIFLILLRFEKNLKKRNEFHETLFFLLYLLSKLSLMYLMIYFPQIKKVHNRLCDLSVLIAKFFIFQSYMCLHFFTAYKQDNYLRNGLTDHSNNIESIKVRVTFTTRKPPTSSPIL